MIHAIMRNMNRQAYNTIMIIIKIEYEENMKGEMSRWYQAEW
jgi:hypothetical protein